MSVSSGVSSALLVTIMLSSCYVASKSPEQSPDAVPRETGPAQRAGTVQTPSTDTSTPQDVAGAAAQAEAKPEPPVRYPFHDALPSAGAVSQSPARQFANMSPGQCRTELKKRKIEVKPAPGPARGVATPLRLTGPLRGIRFVAPGAKSVYGMLDCRLVLALDELAVVVERHEISEIHVDNFYRPRAHLPGKKHKRSQHAYGLAVDVYGVKLQDGRTLVVERDWHGTVGTPSCGPDSAVTETSDESIRLRNLFCDIARLGIFHHLLTPSYDLAHSNHLHMDIKRDERTIQVR